MHIAFTHNLQVTGSEDEAEFDSPQAVNAISDALRRLGHEVDAVEVTGSAARLVARLEASRPHLVFNTAEGRAGRYREAFYPALFEQLGLEFTGSDAYGCGLTLDKRLTKLLVAAEGVPTPKWQFVERADDALRRDFTFPVVVKPNFEGSGRGITPSSLVVEPESLPARVRELLSAFPEGVLVEEYVAGRDFVVLFLEGAAPETDGVLPPAESTAREGLLGPPPGGPAASSELPASALNELVQLSRVVFRTLGLRDMGQADYRVTADGTVYFLEVDALPSLAPGAFLYEAAASIGLNSMESVLAAIIRSADRRYGIREKRHSLASSRKRLRVGVTYNLKRIKPSDADDTEAEFDSPETIGAITEAIASFGYEVVPLEASPEFLEVVRSSGIDVVFNIAEGVRGRGREALVPAVLELLDIQYTGSDPATLALSLDKALAKRIVRQAGVPTADFLIMQTGKERLPPHFEFPLIVKPNAEGSSKGVLQKNVVQNEDELREAVTELGRRYKQGVLVETFLPGREFTVGVLGNLRPRILPPMEIVFLDKSKAHPIYSFTHKQGDDAEVRFEVPAKLDPTLAKEVETVSRQAFLALGCRDVARIDLRCDARGKVHFIEVNPLPGLAPDFSDLCVIAKAAGMSYRSLIGEILAPALRRRERQLRESRSL